jgi:hypothetical protein
LIGLGNPPGFSVKSLALARRMKMTSGAAAAMQRKTTAIVNVERLIAPRLYQFVIAVWRAKEAESNSRKQYVDWCS